MFLGRAYLFAISVFVVEVLCDINRRKKINSSIWRIAQIFVKQIRRCFSKIVKIFIRIVNVAKAESQNNFRTVNIMAIVRVYFYRSL